MITPDSRSVVDLPALPRDLSLRIMDLNKLRRYLLARGIVRIYTLFMAGYFLLPMATGHRRLYFILVLPGVLLLWQDLKNFYRGNTLFLCMTAYAAYMLASLAWIESFSTLPALVAIAMALAALSFSARSDFLWIQYPQRMDRLAHRSAWVAAAVACLSVLVWYLGNPKEWWHRLGEFSFRPGIWGDLPNSVQNRWVFGRGLLSNTEIFAYDKVFPHAHNSYLATVRDGGLAGLLLLLLTLGVALVWATRLARERGERIYLAMILYAMTCIAMGHDRLLTGPREIWLFFWLPIAQTIAVYPHRQDPGLLCYRSHH
ncbi:MAG: hypothetical protein O7F73_08300 [Gammaproteobacteria bacterium]|nr:hypothetical protein [Gammaproteobacteria bacterium]